MEHNVKYFLKKFKSIPEDQWSIFTYLDDSGKRDASGHCGEFKSNKPTDESLNLEKLFEKNGLRISLVNDGQHIKYKQDTPKKRILAALNDIA